MSDGYVTLIATARPKNDQPFPIVLANDIKGGLHFAKTLEEMRAIPSQRLQIGMLCYVENDMMYQYREDNEWHQFVTAGGGTGGGNANTYICETVDDMYALDKQTISFGTLCYVKSEQYMYFRSEADEGWTKFGTGSGGGGGGFDFIWGDTPPDAVSTFNLRASRASTKTTIWIDSSTPYSLDPAPHKDRIKINYMNMVSKCAEKLNDIENKFSKIERKLNLIEDGEELIVKFAEYTDKLSALQIKLENVEQLVINGEQISDYRVAAQETRKEINTFVYTMLDYYNDIMTKIDEEMGLALENSGNEDDDKPDTPTNPSSIALITEDGDYILTEDGLLLLPDGMEEVSYSQSTLLMENGLPLLTEDGSLILLDGYSDKIENNSSNITKDTLMTENDKALLTEDSKRLLLN